MTKIYYFPDSYVELDCVYGDQMPVCLDAAEIERLSQEFEVPDMMDCFHEATADELATYGVYDSDAN